METFKIIYTALNKVFSQNKELVPSNVEPELVKNKKALNTFRDIYENDAEDYRPEHLGNAFEIIEAYKPLTNMPKITFLSWFYGTHLFSYFFTWYLIVCYLA